jgi:hypothetical protein
MCRKLVNTLTGGPRLAVFNGLEVLTLCRKFRQSLILHTNGCFGDSGIYTPSAPPSLPANLTRDKHLEEYLLLSDPGPRGCVHQGVRIGLRG